MVRVRNARKIAFRTQALNDQIVGGRSAALISDDRVERGLIEQRGKGDTEQAGLPPHNFALDRGKPGYRQPAEIVRFQSRRRHCGKPAQRQIADNGLESAHSRWADRRANMHAHARSAAILLRAVFVTARPKPTVVPGGTAHRLPRLASANNGLAQRSGHLRSEVSIF